MATPTVAAPVIPPGIYRIIVADSVEPAWLTNGEDYVTIDSPGARPAPEQEVIRLFWPALRLSVAHQTF